jgi:hypothetical protein
MNQTIESLLAAGLSMKNIQTSHYSLSLEKDGEPFEANKQNKPEKNPEFVVSNRLTIKMDRVNNLGEIIDAAIKAGSNDILSIDFGLNDPRNQTEEALTLAIEDAERKAEVMASKAGVKLRKILEISEGYGYISARDGFAYEAAAPITPIQPGEMDVKASVTMTYEII